jgi:hypothetical protein
VELGVSAERDSGPALVSVSVAGVEHLHRLTHRAANRSRSVEDWWENSLGTALAAVARARHSSGSRDEAERALDRLLRWWRDETPRRISLDVAALALAARAAADLQQSDLNLLADAADAVDDLARREPTAVPMLHLALSVWALDALIPDRSDKPWSALRERLAMRAAGGIDEPLRIYSAAVAAEHFDPNALVQNLYSAIGTSPSASDACVLIWLMTVALERLSQSLEAKDNALQLLVQRRAAIVDRLVGDIDDETFLQPELEEFGEPIPENLLAISFLSAFEALLVDLALASREEADAWLTFPEAEALFAAEAKSARRELERTANVSARWLALLVGVLSVAAGAVSWLGLTDLHWKHGVVASVAVLATALGLAAAALVANRGDLPEKLAESLGIGLVTIAGLAALEALNEHRTKPFISDNVGLIAGVLITAAAVAAWNLAVWLSRKQSRLSEPRA